MPDDMYDLVVCNMHRMESEAHIHKAGRAHRTATIEAAKERMHEAVRVETEVIERHTLLLAGERLEAHAAHARHKALAQVARLCEAVDRSETCLVADIPGHWNAYREHVCNVGGGDIANLFRVQEAFVTLRRDDASGAWTVPSDTAPHARWFASANDLCAAVRDTDEAEARVPVVFVSKRDAVHWTVD